MSNPTVELWTLYALGVSFTVLRTYARISAVGVGELRPDDYLIWLAIAFYTAQTTLGYHVGVAARGLANNGMTPEQRSALLPGDPEYSWRVIGSKIQVAGWSTAMCLLWTLKLCIAFFYLRLTTGLQLYQKRIYISMGLIGATFIAVILTVFCSCRPFNHYWQINPDPGNQCQAAISKPILWVTFVSNVSTDIILFCIPLPMLWKSSLRVLKKIAATVVLSGGLLIIVCATLKSIYVIVDPINGGQAAASWGTRETFIAVVTTNLPMIFPLLKTWILPILPSNLRSSSANNKIYKQSPGGGFVTIGGTSGRNRTAPHSVNHISANMTFDNESEEHIVKENGDGVKMGDLRTSPHGRGQIMVSKRVDVTTEDFGSERSVESGRKVQAGI